MEKFKLSETQAQLLRTQVIDVNQPGPILHDFQVILDFVGPQGVEAAGKYNLLPIRAIDELDQRLSRPLRLGLQRPQLRSHPYLQGLHLLFRASGLSRVEGVGAKSRLRLDPVMIEQWHRLNPPEQYFTLLEAWLLVGRPEMVGDQRGRWDNFLRSCLTTWRYFPPAGKKYDVSRPAEVYIGEIGRDFYHLALMDLFGLMEIEHPRSVPHPWVPAGLKHRPFGDGVFTLLGQQGVSSSGYILEEKEGPDEEEGPMAVRFGRWQPLFQPYFPQWQNNLTVPRTESRSGVFVFRVSLRKDMWREIAMPADATLDDLVTWVLRSVNFDCDHLYHFSYRDRFGTTVRIACPEVNEEPATDQVHIGELPLDPGQSMTLLYDFGDEWPFTVKLERIEPPGKVKAPRIVKKLGKAPEQYPQWE